MTERIVHSSDSFHTHKLESKQILTDDCCAGLGSHAVDMLPSPFSLNLQQKCFLAGFRDCRQEVLRYLIDIEQVPVEGSVVIGLEQHLTKLETLMQTSQAEYADCFCDALHGSTASHPEELHNRSDDCGAVSSLGTEPAAEEHFHDRNITNQEQSPFNCLQSSTQHALINSRSAQESVANRHLCVQNNSFDSGCDSSLVSSSANSSMVTDTTDTLAPLLPAPEMTNLSTTNVSLQEPVTESELAENALELMHLAQNNPNISRILNELFYLMDDDYVCTDDEGDEDDDDGVEMDNEEMDSAIDSENLDNV